jgi:ATP-dependent DNA ligase
MPLVRIPAAFHHPDWLFEVKYDGFRALAYVEGHLCRLVSRRGHEFTKFTLLAEEIAHTVRLKCAVLDGEIACLTPDGRSQFYSLLFRREWPSFAAFDLLEANGENLRERPLLERKRRLRQLVPRSNSRLLYVDHVRRGGVDLFREVCARDCEGIVAKWARGRYETDGCSTSWLKIKNPDYSQMVGRRKCSYGATGGSAIVRAGALRSCASATASSRYESDRRLPRRLLSLPRPGIQSSFLSASRRPAASSARRLSRVRSRRPGLCLPRP